MFVLAKKRRAGLSRQPSTNRAPSQTNRSLIKQTTPSREKTTIRIDPIGKAEIHLRIAAIYDNVGLKNLAAAEYQAFLKKRPDYQDRKKLERYITENKKP